MALNETSTSPTFPQSPLGLGEHPRKGGTKNGRKLAFPPPAASHCQGLLSERRGSSARGGASHLLRFCLSWAHAGSVMNTAADTLNSCTTALLCLGNTSLVSSVPFDLLYFFTLLLLSSTGSLNLGRRECNTEGQQHSMDSCNPRVYGQHKWDWIGLIK